MYNSLVENITEIMRYYDNKEEAKKIIDAIYNYGTPDDFDDEGSRFFWNADFGTLFLSNNENQVAVLRGDRLETCYCTPTGIEGTREELKKWLKENPEDFSNDDKEYINSLH